MGNYLYCDGNSVNIVVAITVSITVFEDCTSHETVVLKLSVVCIAGCESTAIH